MNDHDFEKRLSEQTFRPLPAEWRREILAQARIAGQPSPIAEPAITWWRALLWPSPRAWAGLAAVWIILLVLNRESEPDTIRSARNVPSPLQQIADARRERNHLFA